jgi:hypothetical protein
MKISEINCETGEAIERDMTAEEIEKHDSELLLAAEIQLQIEAKQAARQRALAKLQLLDLTEEEASALSI